MKTEKPERFPDLTAWPRDIIEGATEQLLKKGVPQWWIDGYSAEVLEGYHVVVSYVHRSELAGRDIPAWLCNLDKLHSHELLAHIVAVGKAYIPTVDSGTREEMALQLEFNRLERENSDPRVKAGSTTLRARKEGGNSTGELKKKQGKVTTDEICKMAQTLLKAKKEPRSIVGIIHNRLGYSKTHIRKILQQNGILTKRKPS